LHRPSFATANLLTTGEIDETLALHSDKPSKDRGRRTKDARETLLHNTKSRGTIIINIYLSGGRFVVDVLWVGCAGLSELRRGELFGGVLSKNIHVSNENMRGKLCCASRSITN
jgi:hypothetical protein